MTSQDCQALRIRANLSQRELAERLGVDVMTVSRWERGLRSIDLLTETYIRLACGQTACPTCGKPLTS